MQLHQYQQIVIDDLRRYLKHYSRTGSYRKAYDDYWDEKRDMENGYECPTENRVYSDNIEGVPHVCLKVPTAGGKTFIACNALEPLFDDDLLPHAEAKAVVWLVPSTTILKQTYDALNNIHHPYRLKINELFHSRVEVYNADDLLNGRNFSQTTAADVLNIFVLSYQSIRARSKEDRRMYAMNGALETFFYDVADDAEWLLQEENVDKLSLINVIRKMQPIVVIDEAHNAMSDLSKEMLQIVRPRFILELTATPRKDKKKATYYSNIISYVSSNVLKDANMIKLPLLVYNHKSVEGVYDYAIDLQKALESKAKQYPEHYVRPIVLLQAQPKSQSEEKETFEKIKSKLIERGINEAEIKIKTASIDEISQENLLSKDCVVRYIITVDALKEGWDCPFAYVLASVANKTSEVAIEQIVGRVLRKPYARKHPDGSMNMSYVVTSSNDFQNVLKKILDALNHQGLDKSAVKVAVAAKSIESQVDLFNPFQEKVLENANEVSEGSAATNEDADEIIILETEQVANNEYFIEGKPNLVVAEATYEADQKQLENEKAQGVINIPNEARENMNTVTIKTEFQAQASEIRLPKFYFSDENGELRELERSDLIAKFELLNIGYMLDFDDIDLQLYQFDTRKEASAVAESVFEYRKASDILQKQFAEALAFQTPEGQLKSLVVKLAKEASLNPINEKETKAYIKNFIDANPRRLEDIKSRYLVYGRIIKRHIEQKMTEFAAKRFEKEIDSGKIVTQAAFSLSPNLLITRPESGIAKSLYEKYHALNGDERDFILDIVGLENVLFWHKFGINKAFDFCINAGFSNHYPDFLIVTKRGTHFLIETKGGDRDNSDTAKKVAIGAKWSQAAGNNFRYFLAFKEPNDMKGVKTFKEVKEIIKNR